MERRFRLDEFGLEVSIGKYANQADGAVWIQRGGTVLLSTVVMAEPADFPGFLPLTVDYREQFAAAGKIPGGYFKREGKFSDKEVLTGRLIDRTIRPLFPKTFFNQVQVFSTVYSVDKQHSPSNLALLATSVALSISKISFLGPVGCVEVGRIKGAWVIDPPYGEMSSSDVKLMVAGTAEGITMVEGSMEKLSESEFLDALFLAHDVIKKQVAWVTEIQQQVGVAKVENADAFDWQLWNDRARSFITDELLDSLCITEKQARRQAFKDARQSFLDQYLDEAVDVERSRIVYGFDDVLKDKMADYIFKTQRRIDGRAFDQVRAISTEVGLLPFSHGSALFNRGQTQALVSVTLGSGQDEQRVDDILHNTIERTFFLHYNFPPFSVGEVRPSRGPSRREVGHGFLATSALLAVLPTSEQFPYTIRVVADILSANGSSSMATVCGAVMALMNAGVPISRMVSGVAMGLLMRGDEYIVLTDIMGDEDAFGLMDFKVTGTEEGMTAIQMDIKYKGGLSRKVLESALAQAKEGRLVILEAMRNVMAAPNPNLSQLVPQIFSVKIPKDKIGAIIGKGGETVRKITEETETEVDIKEDGLVRIFGKPGPKLEKAIAWVKTLAGIIEPGTIYQGTVKRVAEFGIFVEIAPGQDGLVHVSSIPKRLQPEMATLYKPGTALTVKVSDYDDATGRIRLKIVSENDSDK